ncbi:hypothetical protein ES707_19048 [subsurface metagenome]
MADVASITEAYIPLEALDGGRVMLHVGNGDMDADTTADLPTKLTNIMSAQICPEAYNAVVGSGIEVFSCTRVIATKKVPVARKADDAAFDKFAFLLVGEVY